PLDPSESNTILDFGKRLTPPRAEYNSLVARIADGLDRELLVGRLQLLQAGDVRLRRREPLEQHRQAGVDAVYVVGGAFHPAILPRDDLISNSQHHDTALEPTTIQRVRSGGANVFFPWGANRP